MLVPDATRPRTTTSHCPSTLTPCSSSVLMASTTQWPRPSSTPRRRAWSAFSTTPQVCAPAPSCRLPVPVWACVLWPVCMCTDAGRADSCLLAEHPQPCCRTGCTRACSWQPVPGGPARLPRLSGSLPALESGQPTQQSTGAAAVLLLPGCLGMPSLLRCIPSQNPGCQLCE